MLEIEKYIGTNRIITTEEELLDLMGMYGLNFRTSRGAFVYQLKGDLEGEIHAVIPLEIRRFGIGGRGYIGSYFNYNKKRPDGTDFYKMHFGKYNRVYKEVYDMPIPNDVEPYPEQVSLVSIMGGGLKCINKGVLVLDRLIWDMVKYGWVNPDNNMSYADMMWRLATDNIEKRIIERHKQLEELDRQRKELKAALARPRIKKVNPEQSDMELLI